MNGVFRSVVTVGAVCCALSASAGIDLHVNGHFRGAATAAGGIATGWYTTSGGAAQLLPGKKPGKHILELSAPAGAYKIAYSDCHTVRGNVLKISVDISGTGSAAIGFEGLDSTRTKVIQSDRRVMPLSEFKSEVKFHFPISSADVNCVRIILTAEPGSVARFGDVDAEFENAPVAPAPAPAPIAPAPAAGGQVLINDGYYSLKSLAPITVFQASVPIGSDIDFELGENISAGQVWSVVNYDPRSCRIKLEHDRDGTWPFIREKAEIEIKPYRRGLFRVEFANANGKRVIVNVTGM